jgi:hypothetical protein
MSQHDLNIANQTAANARSDINSALQALGSNNSGSSAPTTTYANMHWYDTSSNILKQRSEANDAWISIGYFDQSTNAFKILDDTIVSNTSGTQTGLLGDQATSAWQAGTGTTESLVSPLKIRSSVVNYVDSRPNWGYVSAPTTLTQYSSKTFTHGLGVAPTSVECEFVCTVANYGYVVGDRLTGGGSQLQASSNRGYVIMIPNNSTTEIKIISLFVNRIPKANGSGEIDAHWNQWDCIVKAKV